MQILRINNQNQFNSPNAMDAGRLRWAKNRQNEINQRSGRGRRYGLVQKIDIFSMNILDFKEMNTF